MAWQGPECTALHACPWCFACRSIGTMQLRFMIDVEHHEHDKGCIVEFAPIRSWLSNCNPTVRAPGSPASFVDGAPLDGQCKNRCQDGCTSQDRFTTPSSRVLSKFLLPSHGWGVWGLGSIWGSYNQAIYLACFKCPAVVRQPRLCTAPCAGALLL